MIIAARVNLLWVNPESADKEKAQDALLDLKHSWCCSDTGVFLEEEIEEEGFVEGGIVSDIEALRQLGVYGNVVFVDTCVEKPFIKAVLEPHRVAWYHTAHIQVDTPVDVNEL